jgi:hypothetical protein
MGNRWSRMNKGRKRAFAIALATAVASTTLNVGSIAANAGTSARGRVIVAFEDLPEDVAEQTLPVGGKKSDINFPEELEVLLYNDDVETEDNKENKKTRKKKTVTVTEEVTEEATEVVQKVVKKQVTKKSDDQEENREAITDEGASRQAGAEGGSVNDAINNPETTPEDTGNGKSDGNGGSTDTGNTGVNGEDSSTGNDAGNDTADNNTSDNNTSDNNNGSGEDSSIGNGEGDNAGNGTGDAGSGNEGGTEDSGAGNDGTEDTESSGGSARVRMSDIIGTASRVAGQAFVPVKAYAAEAGANEEDGTDSTENTDNTSGAGSTGAMSDNSIPSSQDAEKKEEKEEKEEKSTDNKVEEKSDSANDADSKDKKNDRNVSGNDSTSSDKIEDKDNKSEDKDKSADSEDDSGSDSLKRLAEGEARTLEDVKWKLDREKSEYGGRFQAVREGDVFYFVPNIRQYGLKSEVDLPTIKVTIVAAEDSVSDDSVSSDSVSSDSVSSDSVSGNTVSGNASPEFDQFMIVGGVKVSVTAPEGVFPEGAVLKVKQIDDAASNHKIEQAVKEDMGLSDSAEVNGVPGDGSSDSEDSEEGNSSGSGGAMQYISFDITITDVSGNEIQPNTEYGKANVTFSQADIVSDYIEAPGEETEGKLSDGMEESKDNSEAEEGAERKSTTNEEGRRVYILGGDEEEADGADSDSGAKKTLRVYHGNEDLSNLEKMDVSLNEADKAVAVDADHFSTYVLVNGTTTPPYNGDTFGDFKIECSGAKLQIELYPAESTPTSTGITDIHITVLPLQSGKPDIKITQIKDVTSQLLMIGGGASGAETNVVMKKYCTSNTIAPPSGKAPIMISNFTGLNLTLSDCFFSLQGGNVTALKITNSSGKITLDKTYIGETVEVSGGSDIEMCAGAAETTRDEGIQATDVVFQVDNSRLTLTGGEGNTSTAPLVLRGPSVFLGTHGTININSGHFMIENYPNGVLFDNSSDTDTTLNINGGFIQATDIPILGSRSPQIYIKGGTHRVCKNFLGVDSYGKYTNYNSNLDISGGSVKVVKIENGQEVPENLSYIEYEYHDSTGPKTYDPHIVKLEKPDGTDLTGEVQLTGRNISPDPFGITDCYTMDHGMLYFWYKDNQQLKSITAGGDEYLYSHQDFDPSTTSIETNPETYKYAASGNTRTTVFSTPYVYFTDIILDKSLLTAGENALKPLLTFVCSDGKSYKGSEIAGNHIPGVYDRLMDITWSVTGGAGNAQINNDKKDNVSVTLPDVASYKLTATLTDSLHNRTLERVFYIPNYISLTAMNLASSEWTVGTPGTFSTAGRTAMGIGFTIQPDNPTALASGEVFKWNITDPSGTTIQKTDGESYTPSVAGVYQIEAVLPKGVSETKDFKKAFMVTCKKPISDPTITIIRSPECVKYTGSPVKQTVVVKDGNKVLKEGTDYVLDYKDNIKIAEYDNVKQTGPRVYVIGKGCYSSQAGPFGFRIADMPTGKITIAGKSFNSFQVTDNIGAYVRTATSAVIEGKNSDGSAASPIKFYVSPTFYATESELKKAAPESSWKTYTGSVRPVTTGDSNNYIYAKIEDRGAYTYISTQRIVDDRTPPISVSINSATISGTQGMVNITGDDKLSGVAYYYVLATDINTPASSIDAETVRSRGIKSDSSAIVVPGLTTTQKFTFYAVAEDRAGNVSALVKRDGVISAGEISAVIRVMGHKYDKLQGEQKIDDYTNETEEIKISAEGNSGVAKIEYLISDKFYSSASAIEGAAKDTKGSGSAAFVVNSWATYNDRARPYLVRNKLNYIYAKITDNGGGLTYISSKGIWEDEINPSTSSTKATPKDTTADATVKGSDKESGVKNYYLLVRKDGETTPSKAEDVVNAGMKAEDGKFKLTGLTANTKYTLYAVTEDKAGNLSEIKKSSMTTKKSATAAKKDAGKAGGAGGSGSGSGSGGKNGSGGSNVKKRTEGAGSADVSGNNAGDELRDGVPYIEDASDGILIGREETSGWDRIMGEVGKASAPAQVFVNMNGSTVVPADALKEAKDRDVTYYFDMNDDITWAVNGLSFTTDPTDVDFRVRVDTKNIPSKLVNEIADVYPHKNLTLEYDGEFGFTAILSIYLGEENEGMYANLYFYNEDDNSLEFVEAVEVDGSGRATFNFLHASDYTVIIRGDALTEKTAADISSGSRNVDRTSGGTPANVPKTTGNLWLIIVSVISLLLCGLILFLPDKKRRRRAVGAPV